MSKSYRKSVPDRESSKHKRPWSGTSLVYLRNRKKVNVGREERVQNVGKDQTV